MSTPSGLDAFFARFLICQPKSYILSIWTTHKKKRTLCGVRKEGYSSSEICGHTTILYVRTVLYCTMYGSHNANLWAVFSHVLVIKMTKCAKETHLELEFVEKCFWLRTVTQKWNFNFSGYFSFSRAKN